MRISRIIIENFRNFQSLDISVGKSAVILGENQVGKTNLVHALRLLLDPNMPDSARQLRIDDFWDGIERPISQKNRIKISVDIADFESNLDHLAILGEHLIAPEPMIARLTYEFGLIVGIESSSNDSDFEFTAYGGDRPENRFGYEVRKRMPLEVLPGLRDAESDLSRWTKSPLRPLIERAKVDIDQGVLDELAQSISEKTEEIADQQSISSLAKRINEKLKQMAGENQAIQTAFGFMSTDPDKLLRALRLLFDDKRRDISEASLGMANILYLALRTLELEYQVEEGIRDHTFYCIEEPEAHLHPHFQRLVYRNYLKPRRHLGSSEEVEHVTYLLTSHSPHIASVSPIESLILLRKDAQSGATVGVSGNSIELSEKEIADIERYLDVSRADGLFSRGILLVEGDAEKYLIPVLAARAGYDLDSYGITICSVGGTNFEPYVKFFGSSGLKIPLAVITDGDPYITSERNIEYRGQQRIHSLYLSLAQKKKTHIEIQKPEFYEKGGIFLNESTLEIELNNSGWIHFMNTTIQELCDVDAAKKRFQTHSDETKNLNKIIRIEIEQSNYEQFIRDIKYVGKGRFAQRLAEDIANCPDTENDCCPPYIKKALEYVINKINKLSGRGGEASFQ